MSVGAQPENTKITTLPGNHQFLQFICDIYYNFHKEPSFDANVMCFVLNSKVKQIFG